MTGYCNLLFFFKKGMTMVVAKKLMAELSEQIKPKLFGAYIAANYEALYSSEKITIDAIDKITAIDEINLTTDNFVESLNEKKLVIDGVNLTTLYWGFSSFYKGILDVLQKHLISRFNKLCLIKMDSALSGDKKAVILYNKRKKKELSEVMVKWVAKHNLAFIKKMIEKNEFEKDQLYCHLMLLLEMSIDIVPNKIIEDMTWFLRHSHGVISASYYMLYRKEIHDFITCISAKKQVDQHVFKLMEKLRSSVE